MSKSAALAALGHFVALRPRKQLKINSAADNDLLFNARILGGDCLCCRFPNRGVQNGQAAGRRTRAHRCRHRGRVCGHAGSARADGVKNKPWFVVGLDLRNTVRKQLSCGSCLSERGRCFFNIGTKFLQSFVFFKCGGSKARPNIIETASPYLPMRGLGCSGPGFTTSPGPFFWLGVVMLPYLF